MLFGLENAEWALGAALADLINAGKLRAKSPRVKVAAVERITISGKSAKGYHLGRRQICAADGRLLINPRHLLIRHPGELDELPKDS